MGLPVRSLAYGVHLFGRGGPPAGLPCGSEIPTYSSFSVRPFSARGGTSFTMYRPAVRARGHAGGGGGLLLVPPHFCWGGGDRGSKKSAPQFPGPQGEPAHGLHPRFVVAEIWADRGRGRGGGGCLLMARLVWAAFGGCCSARTSWFPCVLLCVLLGLVSLPCVGRPCAQLFCCLRSSQFRALSFSAGMLTASGVRRRGGNMSLPASHCGCRVVPLTVGCQGHRALLYMSPNLQTDLSLVFVGGCCGVNVLRCCSLK